MTLPLPEYRVVRQLRESGNSRVFEAESRIDGSRVIAKVFDLEYGNIEDRVVHEFELIRSLDVEGVVEARELRRVGDQWVLVLEHVSGVDLRELTEGQPLELARFWPIAIQVAEILAQTHAHKVIHRDIKPTNVLVDDRGCVHLADFGISVLLESERRHIYDASLLVGTLPYISPEQTGRTNRAVDFRSDLYSLGVTFYQLLTGRLPFECTAPLELIHAHLARVPEPIATLRPELPDALSRLVARLLAKAPEHRYQTAAGLAADLRRIRTLVAAGEPSEGFEIGREDLSVRLALPHQLYGREREQALLLAEYRALLETRGRRALLLAGPVGVGKSALTSVLEAAVAGDGGYLVRGKFERSHGRPYSGFVEALRAMGEQILTESDARLARWRHRLLEGLAGLAAVACDIVPTLGLILGDQPPPPELGLLEARSRIEFAMERLIATLCEPRRPLVLVLDDLESADRSSLALLDTLLQTDSGPLLILATVRADEPEARALIGAGRARERVGVLPIEPLAIPAIQQLLAVTLARPLAELETLAEIVAHKTGGVPLFIGQFLTDLVDRGWLRPSVNTWTWDDAEVAAARIPDDAVEMMSAKLDALAPEARDLLGRAACLGSRFDLPGLALVCELPRARLATISHELAGAGLLAEIGSEYRFPHDSLRAAALRQLPAERRRQLHWTIGKHMLATLGESDDELFVVVDHLDAGAPSELDEDLSTQVELAALDLRAGQRALDTGAYAMAQRYLSHGLARVSPARRAVAHEGRGADHYELVFELYFAHALALALALERERANGAFAELLGWKLADHHRARVVARRVRLLFVEARPREAVELGLAALTEWGVVIPLAPAKPRALQSLVRAWWFVRSLDRDALFAIPECRDPLQAGIVDVVAQLKHPALATNRMLFVYLAGLHARMLSTHGFHPSTPGALADLAAGVSGGLGRVADGIAFVDRALELCERLPNPQIARFGVVVPGSVLAWHRGRSFTTIVRLLARNYPEALECGELDRASFMAALTVNLEIDIGTHLGVLERRARELVREVSRWGTKSIAANLWVDRCWCSSMLATPVDPDDPDDADVRELDFARIEARGGIATTQYIHRIDLAMFHLLHDDRPRVLAENLATIRERSAAMLNLWIVARAALIMIVAIEGERMRDRPVGPGASAVVRWGLRILRRWAQTGAENYGHYLELALGVQAAARGRLDPALDHLDRAWTSARQRGCRWVEGLAAEVSAELLERRGSDLLVAGAWRRTWDAYAAWGAARKLEQLRVAKPELFDEQGPRGPSGRRTELTSARTGSSSSSSERSSTPSLDLEGVLRSVGVITEELGLDVVVRRVLDAASTSAGADHGILLLEREGELAVVATHVGDAEQQAVLEPLRLRDAGDRAPSALVNFVVRTNQWLVLDDVRLDPRFVGDPYLVRNDVRSVLALPIAKAGRQLGVLVLENRLTTHGFTTSIIETLRLITSQAASILDNARLHAALRRSEARWRSLVDGAPDVIALLDETGSIAFANRRGPFVDLQASDEPSSEGVLSKTSAADWREAVAFVLARGRPRELELELELDHDRRRWYAVRIAPIDPDGEAESASRNAVAVATDISDRKRAEAERRVLEVQLRQQQRLDSLGTLASGVAHEINNPIQGIMNYADLISTNSGSRAMVEEFSYEILHESERVATIVRNLLAFSRQEIEQPQESIEIGRIIEATLSLVHSVLRKDHIRLTVALGTRASVVRCRNQQIQQILMNLVTNARDAVNQRHGPGDRGEGGKRIDIRVESIERDARPWIRVVVEDSGSGIPDDVLPRIFDPFFTTKGRDQGTGLGLAVSHGLAIDNDGELSVETRDGEGTRFFLDLPAVG